MLTPLTVFDTITQGAASVFSEVTQGAGSVFTEVTSGAASVFTDVTSGAGSVFTDVTSGGKQPPHCSHVSLTLFLQLVPYSRMPHLLVALLQPKSPVSANIYPGVSLLKLLPSYWWQHRDNCNIRGWTSHHTCY